MKLTKWRAAVVGAGVALLATMAMTPPSIATAASDGIIEENGPRGAAAGVRDGTDFDPACVLDVQRGVNGAPAANPVASPDGTAPFGCTYNDGLVSTYDGNQDGGDISTIILEESATAGFLSGTWHVDGSVPPPGNTNLARCDVANSTFTGCGYRILFQNTDKQTNHFNQNSGCFRDPPSPAGTRVRDQRGHWEDGFHFFVGVDAEFIPTPKAPGGQWIWSFQIGEYDPTPDGAFFFTELGTYDGNTVTNLNPLYTHGTDWGFSWANAAATGPGTITLWFNGLYKSTDELCTTDEFTQDYFASGNTRPGWYGPGNANGFKGCGRTAASTYNGDCIQGIKGLTTANQTVESPVVIPLSSLCGQPEPIGDLLCFGDVKSLAGFLFFVDTTKGSSTVGAPTVPATNIPLIAYSGGLIGGTDTLGEQHNCPTPTFGGTAPDNPLWADNAAGADVEGENENRGCNLDDDSISILGGAAKGWFLTEWWDTNEHFFG